jgi:hypothetical protein
VAQAAAAPQAPQEHGETEDLASADLLSRSIITLGEALPVYVAVVE